MAPTVSVKKPASGKAQKRRKTSNFDLGNGVMRFARNATYKRRALYRLKGVKKPAVAKKPTPVTIVKKIGGAKNGGERVVYLKKSKPYYPTKARVQSRPSKNTFSRHVRNTRKNLKPGRVVILLAGRHAGKRVVLLKVLKSGLLLVNGPFYINSCPLRRISQRYVMATSTLINLGAKYELPEHINDTYFKRAEKKQRRGEGDIFAAKKEKYVPSEQRKQDQVTVDKACKDAIKNNKEKKYLFKYLKALFGLKSSQYPHRMKF